MEVSAFADELGVVGVEQKVVEAGEDLSSACDEVRGVDDARQGGLLQQLGWTVPGLVEGGGYSVGS